MLMKLETGVFRYLICLSVLGASSLLIASEDTAGIEFFETHIRPVLAENCFKCHSHQAPKLKGKLYVDSLKGLLDGGETGPAVVLGDPEKSLLIEAVSYKNSDMQMPPKSKLSDAQIADLTNWVKRGAPWPKTDTLVSTGPENAGGFDIQKLKAQHWAWAPVKPETPPDVKNTAWVKNDIDRFILEKLEENHLQPAPAADKRTLIRRAYLDLIGIPPTPSQVNAFIQNTAPDAYEKLIDSLLASPQFGERWARHWLDLVRYAETRGHEYDYPIPNAYQYRDYVIRALNADVPYNQFVTEHLAGDLMPNPRTNPEAGFNESILGTGYWFLGEGVHSPVDIRQDEADRFDNMVDVTCKTFLGLTVACARCHDHKFDAIRSRDYYSMFGFLESSSYRLVRFETQLHNRKVAEKLWALRDSSKPTIAKAVAASIQPGANHLADYLIAAREAIQAGADAQKKTTELASAHNLDASILGNWVAHLQTTALKDAGDPFHAWAKISKANAGDPLAIVKSMARPKPDLSKVEAVVDYAKLGNEDWFPDDVSYGPAPAKPGDIRLGKDPSHPIEEICARAAAQFDSTFQGLKPAPDSPLDAVGLGYMRPGKTIRTRSFALTNGRVFILCRGSGHIYAAVDKHVLVNGPLHGQIIKKVESKDNAFNWHYMDLTAYKDHHTHLEFTSESPDFAVAEVVLGDQPPQPETPSDIAAQSLVDEKTTDGIAKAYQRMALEALSHLQSGTLAGSASAELANWLVQHPALTGAAAVDSAKPFMEAQAKLASELRLESHLAMAMQEGSGEDDYVMKRGVWKNRGEDAPRQLLEAIAGTEQPRIKHGSGRLELAQRMTDTSNPFITRVIVNRLWHYLFGKGIVSSVDNFGVLGTKPTHPKLLDYLATTFVKEGWSLKKTIKLMMMTNTYQMASAAIAAADEADPENHLLHRMNVRRAESEVVRDEILAVSGRLNLKMYGAGVPIFLNEFMDGRGKPNSGPLDGDGRRSVYMSIHRNFLSPMMMAFDTPIPFNTVGRRASSNVPAQALILMNDPFVVQEAQRWAKRVLAAEGLTPEQRISQMYETAFARLPQESETRAALQFMDTQSKELGIAVGAAKNDVRVWSDLAHVLMNCKEFIFVN